MRKELMKEGGKEITMEEIKEGRKEGERVESLTKEEKPVKRRKGERNNRKEGREQRKRRKKC